MIFNTSPKTFLIIGQYQVIDNSMDRSSVIACSSDNTGNTRITREVLSSIIPTMLNLPDPNHHLNNTWKEIAELPYFEQTVDRIQGTIKLFQQSKPAKAKLKEACSSMNLGPGLESIGKTRFITLQHSGASLYRNMRALHFIVTSEEINIPVCQVFIITVCILTISAC